MGLARTTMIERMLESDASYDGRFLTGVLSTGVFCLPSCRARKPNPENVRFFHAPEDALAAGLRPCKRCRPDFFYRGWDPDHELVKGLVETMRSRPAEYRNARQLVARSGVGASKLHALFRAHWHATPAEMLARARVDRACQLLAESGDPIADIAFAVGFETLSSFNQVFLRRVRMTPLAYRRLGEDPSFVVDLPKVFASDLIWTYMSRDGKSPSESRNGGRVVVVRRIGSELIRLELELARGRVRCRCELAKTWSPTLARATHRAALRLLGLVIDPSAFERRAGTSPLVAKLIAQHPGLSIPQTADFFEALVWVIAGQQVSLPVAFALRRRLTRRVGAPVDGGGIAPPSATMVAEMSPGDLRELGFSTRKTEYVLGVARSIADGSLVVESLRRASATAVAESLLAIRGIGDWSARYLMMRALGFADCVPAGDVVLQRKAGRFFGLEQRPSETEVRKLMQCFAPHRSLATFHLWSMRRDP